MYRIQYLFHQVFSKIKYEKRRYMLYIFSFYTGLLLPAFCIANIRSADQVIYYTTFEGMEQAVQIDWLGERFDAVKLGNRQQRSVSAVYEEDFPEWNHQYVTVHGIDEHYFYPLPEITGRAFKESEFKRGENVCLLSQKIAEDNSYRLGDLVSIQGEKFEIAGFTENEKFSGIIIPYRAMEKIYSRENLIQFSCVFLEEDENVRLEAAEEAVWQIENTDEHAEMLETTDGSVLYENALATKARWRFVRGAAAGVSLLFFILNEIIVLAGKIEKEQRVIGVNMAMGASEREIRDCLFFETLLITSAAAVLVLFTLIPLAKAFGLGSAVTLDKAVVIIFLAIALLTCELLTWGAFGTIRKRSISMMLKEYKKTAGDLR